MKDFLRRRKLTKAIASIERERDRSLGREHPMKEGLEILIASDKRIDPLREQLDRLTSRYLVSKATKLGIDIPKECWHYVSNPDFPGFAPLDWYLQESGQRTVAKLIKKERRENLEWWIKVITPILSLIVGILGLLVTGFTIWLAWSSKNSTG